jgi:XTP/dITP diphosphohydrolase
MASNTPDRPLLLLATGNPHKVGEMRALLGVIPYELVSPADLGLKLEIDEPFMTYRENAGRKARAYAEASGLPALADDSGIEIDALDGTPGVLSARFGSPEMPYPERFDLIAARIASDPQHRRGARYRCVLALASPDPLQPVIFTEGTVAGEIIMPPRGTHGFGYDPIFWLPDRQQTMAELLPAEKDAISHRGQAARALAEILRRGPWS